MENEEMFASIIDAFYNILEISHESIMVGKKIIYAEYEDKYCELNIYDFNSEEEAFCTICADEIHNWIEQDCDYLTYLTDEQIIFLKKYFDDKMSMKEIQNINALVKTLYERFEKMHAEKTVNVIDAEIAERYKEINKFKKIFGFENNSAFDVVIAYAQYIGKLNCISHALSENNCENTDKK